MECSERLPKACCRSLNPYYNGRYSWSSLLLLLSFLMRTVLILIIMEDTHGEPGQVYLNQYNSLNPYYNGRYSWRTMVLAHPWKVLSVLILIIMEDTHGVESKREA